MELKNMTNEELTELVSKINIELKERENNKCKEYQEKLRELIEEIRNNNYTILIDDNYETVVTIDKYSLTDVYIEI